jgi:DHA2 family multidrug resistance protein-like MFS transporter
MRATATAREWAGLAVLALPCLLVSLDAEVLNLAAPQLSAALRPSGVQLLWIMDSYVFVVAGALIAMGVLGDRIGRRRLLLASGAAFGVASMLAAFAQTPEQLIAARVLMGLSGASLMPSTLALIRVMFIDPRQRSVAFGVWSASFSLGGVAAPLIGGVLLEHFWWGSVFTIAVPATALLLVLGPLLLPESRDRTPGRFDFPGALMSLAAILLFVYGLKKLAASGWAVTPFAAMVVALLLGLFFLLRQRRIAHPLLDLSLFRSSRVSVALTSNALSYFVLYGTQLAIAQYLQLVLGLSPLHAGLWMLPSVLAFLGSSLLAPEVGRLLRPGRAIFAGLVVMTAGFGVLATAGLSGVVAGTVIFSIGLAPVYILSTELVVSSVRSSRAGMAAAVTETGSELGGALGIAVLGSLGVAAFRHGSGLGGEQTLSDAVSQAAALPGRAGEELLSRASVSYTGAFGLMSLAAAALVAVAAVLAWRVLRPLPAALAVGDEPVTELAVEPLAVAEPRAEGVAEGPASAPAPASAAMPARLTQRVSVRDRADAEPDRRSGDQAA